MTFTIRNSRVPQYGHGAAFAEFRIILRRDGDKIVLDAPTPRCFREFVNFTGAEKDAYNAIVTHVVEGCAKAMHSVEGSREE